jgi:hypothetical protein
MWSFNADLLLGVPIELGKLCSNDRDINPLSQ